jgi:type IV pilus assembly protein PilB
MLQKIQTAPSRKRQVIPKRIKLGEMLILKGKLTPEKLYELLQIQKQSSQSLGALLVEQKILSKEELNQELSEQLGIPHVWIRKGLVDPHIVNILPKEKALQFNVIPLFKVNNILTIATSNPYDFFVQDKVCEITNLQIQQVLSRAGDIREAIKECYQNQASIDDVMSSMEEGELEFIEKEPEMAISEIATMAEGSPVINLTNLILLKAIKGGASDIHIEPQPGHFRVRARIDGVLYELMKHGIERHTAVVSRLKVMANLDISERRIPQDGRIQVSVDGNLIDLRFSSIPGSYGEKIVLRILDRSKSILDLNKLGFTPELLTRFKQLIRKENGLIIVCGPTGSGKTTTLYSGISMLNTIDKNIVSIEDPVEYQLLGLNQVPVNSSIGLTFAKILKHVLRQDPDIILVGEIRDKETAKIAVQASLTGHLVLTTLHTNDGASAITRLLEMGVEPYLISSSLLAVIGQRLVRSICPHCKTDFLPKKETLKHLGLDQKNQIRFSKGKGCSACFDSGFKGRIGIHELLENDDELQRLILNNPTVDRIKDHLKNTGHKSLQNDGYQKVIKGHTTLEEVQRVTSVDMV